MTRKEKYQYWVNDTAPGSSDGVDGLGARTEREEPREDARECERRERGEAIWETANIQMQLRGDLKEEMLPQETRQCNNPLSYQTRRRN